MRPCIALVCPVMAMSCGPAPSEPREPAPSAVADAEPASLPGNRICVGEQFSCARMADGLVYCWGDNSRAQLGTGTLERQSEPVMVSGLHDAVEVVCESSFACARSARGPVSCWGSPVSAGPAALRRSLLPQMVRHLYGAEQIAVGQGGICAVQRENLLTCAGSPWSTDEERPSFGSVAHVAMGPSRTCAVAVDGTLGCWGLDLCGGARRSAAEARRYAFDKPAVWVGASQRMPVRFSDGTLRLHGCQQGKGATDEPLPVVTLTHTVRVFDSPELTCAIRSDRSVWCAGWDRAAIMPIAIPPASFVEVPMLRGATDIALGAGHGCAGFTGGTLRCWGYDAAGELGRGEHALLTGRGGRRQWLGLEPIHVREDERPWTFEPTRTPIGAASLPPPEVPCAGPECTVHGRCARNGRACVAASDEHCGASLDCRERGLCGARDGVCAATRTADCRRSAECVTRGACTAVDGVCAVASDADCQISEPCANEGRCSAGEGRCVVGKDADCRVSPGCAEEGLCSWREGRCVAGSLEDCQASARCKGHGRCVLSGERCEAYPEVP